MPAVPAGVEEANEGEVFMEVASGLERRAVGTAVRTAMATATQGLDRGMTLSRLWLMLWSTSVTQGEMSSAWDFTRSTSPRLCDILYGWDGMRRGQEQRE